MVNPVIKLGVIVSFVLPIHLFDLGCELNVLFIYDQVLNALPHVEVIIDMRPGGVEGSENHTLSGSVLHQRVLGGI
jgi:hypothetical protein